MYKIICLYWKVETTNYDSMDCYNGGCWRERVAHFLLFQCKYKSREPSALRWFPLFFVLLLFYVLIKSMFLVIDNVNGITFFNNSPHTHFIIILFPLMNFSILVHTLLIVEILLSLKLLCSPVQHERNSGGTWVGRDLYVWIPRFENMPINKLYIYIIKNICQISYYLYFY